MLNLYLDTNIYLTFYHLTSEDLEELKKLSVITTNEDVKLFLPAQTKDEFNRNRETKIADALKRFRGENLPDQFPQFCKSYVEYKELRAMIKEYERTKSILLDKITTDISTSSLQADKVIKKLFISAEIIETTDNLFELAKKRMDLGKPPGKDSSYGDAVNWEALLNKVPILEDLYFISGDKDYYSEIDNNKFNNYLLDEWENNKKSNLFHYKKISDFFKEKFPAIKIASEYEKELAIAELVNSSTFSTTHYALIKLNKFDDFSEEQLQEMLRAFNNNSQISWIRGDADVSDFAKRWLVPNHAIFSAEDWHTFESKYLQSD